MTNKKIFNIIRYLLPLIFLLIIASAYADDGAFAVSNKSDANQHFFNKRECCNKLRR